MCLRRSWPPSSGQWRKTVLFTVRSTQKFRREWSILWLNSARAWNLFWTPCGLGARDINSSTNRLPNKHKGPKGDSLLRLIPLKKLNICTIKKNRSTQQNFRLCTPVLLLGLAFAWIFKRFINYEVKGCSWLLWGKFSKVWKDFLQRLFFGTCFSLESGCLRWIFTFSLCWSEYSPSKVNI